MRRFQVVLAKHPRLLALVSCLVLLGLSYTWVRGQGLVPASSPVPGAARDHQPAPDRTSGRAGSTSRGGNPRSDRGEMRGDYGGMPGMPGMGAGMMPGGMGAGMGPGGMDAGMGPGGMVDESVAGQASSFRAELIVLKADWSAGDNASRRPEVEAELQKLLEGYSLPSEQLAAIARQPTRFLFPDELAAFYRAEDWEATLAWMREKQLVMSQQKGEVDVEDQAGRPSRTARSRVGLSLELEKSRWPAGIQTPSDPVRIKQLTSKYRLVDHTPVPNPAEMHGGMRDASGGYEDMGGAPGGGGGYDETMGGMPGGGDMMGGMMGMGYSLAGVSGGEWMTPPINPTDHDDAIRVQISSQLVEEELLHFPVTSTLDSRTLLHFGTALWLPAGHVVVMPWYGPRDTSLREKSLRDGADALLVIHAGGVNEDMSRMGGPGGMGMFPGMMPGGMEMMGRSDASWLRRPQKLVPLKLVIAERSNVWDDERTSSGMGMGMPGMGAGVAPIDPKPSAEPTALPRAEDGYGESGDEAARSPTPPLDGPVDPADEGFRFPPSSVPALAAEIRPATDPVEDQTTLAQARQRYHRSERLAAEQASRARAIPDDDPGQAEALETLRQAVREAFARRLELQRLEAATLRQRLGRLETNLNQRESLSDEITARRVEQLLEDPATRWDADPAELNR